MVKWYLLWVLMVLLLFQWRLLRVKRPKRIRIKFSLPFRKSKYPQVIHGKWGGEESIGQFRRSTDTHWPLVVISLMATAFITYQITGYPIPFVFGALLPGRNFRNLYTITGVVGATTNYQMRVVVHYGSGTDSDGHVYCNSNCQTDFGDVRWTASDGSTEEDYSIEWQIDGVLAIFWVEVTADLDSNQSIYTYYGSSGTSTTTSSAADTFLFNTDYDDEANWTDGDCVVSQNSEANVYEPKFYEHDTVIREDATKYLAFQHVCKLSNGNIIVTYREGTSHQTDQGVLKQKISSDGGRTWGAETEIASDGTYDVRTGVVFQAGDGDVILIIDLYDHINGLHIGAKLAISTDNGASYGSFTDVDASNLWRCFRFIQVVSKGSDFYATVNGYGDSGKTPGDLQTYIYKSTDDGESWSLHSSLPQTDTTDESTIYNTSGTDWICIVRDTSKDVTYKCLSADDLGTWGALVDISAQVGVVQFPMLIHDGTNLLLIGRKFNTTETDASHSVLYTSTDDGTSFTDGHIIFSYISGGSGGNGGYISPFTISATEVGLVYYKNTTTTDYPDVYIKFLQIPIAATTRQTLKFVEALGDVDQAERLVTITPTDYAIECLVSIKASGAAKDQFGMLFCDGSTADRFANTMQPYKDETKDIMRNIAGIGAGGRVKLNDLAFDIYETDLTVYKEIRWMIIIDESSPDAIYYIYDSIDKNFNLGNDTQGQASYGSPTDMDRLLFGSGTSSAGCEAYMRYLFIRKYVSPEPTGSWGGQEVLTAHRGKASLLIPLMSMICRLKSLFRQGGV